MIPNASSSTQGLPKKEGLTQPHARPSWAATAIAFSFIVSAIAHYALPHTPENHAWHHVHYLMFFAPIVLASIWFGVRWGFPIALISSLVYAPPIFLHGAGMDNVSMLVEGALEVVIYLVVGISLGLTTDRERKQHALTLAASESLRVRSQELLEAERQMAQSERLNALGRLATVVAHEVRNPLGSIKGSAEILRDDFPADHDKHRFLSILVNETTRLDHVLDNFLNFARSPALEIKPLCPTSLLENLVTLMAPQCERQNVEITLNTQDSPQELHADADQLQQALMNMVLNAAQSMPAGGSIAIQTEATEEDDETCIRFSVTDTGPGLDETAVVRAGEPYFSTKGDGTGLGLTVVQNIVEAHGGQFSLENRTDGVTGAVASISIPAQTEGAHHV